MPAAATRGSSAIVQTAQTRLECADRQRGLTVRLSFVSFDGRAAGPCVSTRSGVVAVDPASGAARWHYEDSTQGWRVVQPHAVGQSQILFGSRTRTRDSDIKHDGPAWTAAKQWASRSMKPAYNDFVVLDDSVYGFDAASSVASM